MGFDEDDGVQIIDTENYREQTEQSFSHQSLVMKSMNKCIEAGCKEMIAGYYNSKFDKFGNKSLVYVPDSRKEFIEHVKTTEMVMICDLDDDCRKNILEIKNKLQIEFKKLCDDESDDWKKLTAMEKRNRRDKGIIPRQNNLNIKLPFYQEYIEYEVECYREVFKELTLLTERKNFYQEEMFEN